MSSHLPSEQELARSIADAELSGAADLATLRLELATVAEACQAARRQGQAGRLFFLLRKQWQLTQRLCQLETQLRQSKPAQDSDSLSA